METAAEAQIPQVTLNFDDLKHRMDSFLFRFDDHVNQARQKIITERNDFAKTMSENKENNKSLAAQIEELQVKETEFSESRAKEQKELEDSRSAIAAHASKRDEAAKSNEHLVEQISETRQRIQQRRDELSSQKQSLASQNSLNRPELDFWQRVLGLRIEGQNEDFIKFVFTQIDNNDGEKEYYFVLDLRNHDYAVSECNPELPTEKIEQVVNALNDSRQLNVFLRDMRTLFKTL